MCLCACVRERELSLFWCEKMEMNGILSAQMELKLSGRDGGFEWKDDRRITPQIFILFKQKYAWHKDSRWGNKVYWKCFLNFNELLTVTLAWNSGYQFSWMCCYFLDSNCRCYCKTQTQNTAKYLRAIKHCLSFCSHLLHLWKLTQISCSKVAPQTWHR